MNSVIITNIVRVIVLIIIQVLIFKRIAFHWGDFAFIHFIIYPLGILLLPVKIPKPLVMVIGFVVGLMVDLFYDSPGVHAAAGVFSGYVRGYILNYLEPYEGFNTNDSPTLYRFGYGWFMTYLSIFLALHLLFYFSVEAFSFVFFFEIMMNTIFSFLASFVIIMLMIIIFKPKV